MINLIKIVNDASLIVEASKQVSRKEVINTDIALKAVEIAIIEHYYNEILSKIDYLGNSFLTVQQTSYKEDLFNSLNQIGTSLNSISYNINLQLSNIDISLDNINNSLKKINDLLVDNEKNNS